MKVLRTTAATISGPAWSQESWSPSGGRPWLANCWCPLMVRMETAIWAGEEFDLKKVGKEYFLLIICVCVSCRCEAEHYRLEGILDEEARGQQHSACWLLPEGKTRLLYSIIVEWSYFSSSFSSSSFAIWLLLFQTIFFHLSSSVSILSSSHLQQKNSNSLLHIIFFLL